MSRQSAKFAYIINAFKEDIFVKKLLGFTFSVDHISSYINPMKTENADHQWKHKGILRSLGRLSQKHILPVTDI